MSPRPPVPSKRKPREGGCKPDHWQTPESERNWVQSWYGYPDLDVASSTSGLGPFGRRYYTSSNNGLRLPWQGRCWLQPPFTTISRWCDKARRELERHAVPPVVLALLPVRTSNKWWHDIEDEITALYFPKGRIRFHDPKLGMDLSGTPFDSVYLLFDRNCRVVEAMRRAVRDRGGRLHR